VLIHLTAACLVAAAHAYSVPADSLYGILRVEAGREGLAVRNHNGTEDLGPFQINTTWVSTFTTYWKQPDTKTTYEMLRDNGCASAFGAAAILRYHLDRTGDMETAIGDYHAGPAGSPAEAAKYLKAWRSILDAELPPLSHHG